MWVIFSHKKEDVGNNLKKSSWKKKGNKIPGVGEGSYGVGQDFSGGGGFIICMWWGSPPVLPLRETTVGTVNVPFYHPKRNFISVKISTPAMSFIQGYFMKTVIKWLTSHQNEDISTEMKSFVRFVESACFYFLFLYYK